MSSSETQTTSSKQEVFDNTAVKGVISERNIVRLPQEEIDKQFPTAFGKLKENGNNTILTIQQPYSESERAKAKEAGINIPDLQYEIREDKGTLQMQYPLDLSQSSDPSAKIKFEKSYGGFGVEDRIALQNKGFYDTLVFYDVPKGTIVEAPMDGFLVISRTNGAKYDPNRSTGGFIEFQSPNGNIYRLAIGGVVGNNIFVFTPLLDAPEFSAEQNRMPVGTYGIPVKKGQPLFQTNTKLDEVGLKISVAIKGAVGEPPEMLIKPFVPTTLELFPSPDNKLINSQK